jgi:hypothetical protein
MPAADTVLLPLCVGLTLLGIIATGIAWRRGNKGRVVQGVALALAPVALYFSGLLRLLWDAVVAVGTWASRIILSPAVWFGLGLLGLCIVLWVVGAIVARRFPSKRKQKAVASGTADRSSTPAVAGASQSSTGRGAAVTKAPAAKGSAGKGRNAAPAAPVDDDLAEIEALLKSRGIN